MQRKQHEIFIILLLILYFLFATIDIEISLSTIYGFIIIYFIVAYMKKYCTSFENSKRQNILLFIITFIIFIVFVLVKNFMSLKFLSLDSSILFKDVIVLFLLPMLLSLFNLFLKLKFKSPFINLLSSCSLFFYCIHENFLVRTILRPAYYRVVLSYYPNYYFWWYCFAGLSF